MSKVKRLSLFHHIGGLSVAAGAATCLALLWIYGLPYLDGTAFEDLFSVVYAVVAMAFLTLAERMVIAGRRVFVSLISGAQQNDQARRKGREK